ncbi:MAG: urease accessory protein UreD [Rhodobacteraceae bacterium]|nr:MAG: urease accessory protein UreD [Paracoccaceae bacterium]
MTLCHHPDLGRSVRSSLTFAQIQGRTHLMGQHTPHPFHITRPFRHPHDPQGMVTLYLQSSSGGLYGDDDLALAVRVEAGAAVHLTTQASTVVHDARGRHGTRQLVTLDVAEGALLEYLPDPSILMAGARLGTRIDARLAPGATLMLADAQMWHDPEGRGRHFDWLESEIQINGADRPLLLERFTVEGEAWLKRTGGFRCAGMVLVAGDIRAADQMQKAADEVPELYAGLSILADRDIAILRFLAQDGVALSRALKSIWAAARLALTGQKPAARRK